MWLFTIRGMTGFVNCVFIQAPPPVDSRARSTNPKIALSISFVTLVWTSFLL